MSDDILSVSVEYHMDRQQILASGPLALGSQMLINETSKEQSMSFSVSKTTEKTSSFSHEVGASLNVGATFSAGIPFLAKTEWSVEVEASYAYTWGETTTEAHSWTASFPIVVGPNAMVQAVASVHQSRADIPYTMEIRYKDGRVQTSRGTYHGVDQTDLTHRIRKELFFKVKDAEGRSHKTGLNMEFFCPRDNKNVIVQKDFDNNHGVGLFNASTIRLGNQCPHCQSRLKVADFRKFWFNQCTVKYCGVLAKTEEIQENAANFTEEPAEFADLDNNWLSLELTLEYYTGSRAQPA
jgi:hypothetical protein